MSTWIHCTGCGMLRSSCDESGLCNACRFRGPDNRQPQNREQLIQQNNEPLAKRRRWFHRDRG